MTQLKPVRCETVRVISDETVCVISDDAAAKFSFAAVELVTGLLGLTEHLQA